MKRLERKPTGHTRWCARGHHCDLSYHRSDVMLVNIPRAGQAIVTRVRNNQGREWMEVTAQIRLHQTEVGARYQVKGLLNGMERLLQSLRIRDGIERVSTTPQIGAAPRRELSESRATPCKAVA